MPRILNRSNYATCKQCNKTLLKISDGTFPNGLDTRWINDKGKLWSGRCCPDCHKENTKTHLKNKRAKLAQ